jgi:hypothetical protein
MTFEQFQATREHCDDLGKALNDARWEDEPPARGYLYLGVLYIEQWGDGWPEHNKGKYLLTIHRNEWLSDDLESLERKLYDFAVSEGYTRTSV